MSKEGRKYWNEEMETMPLSRLRELESALLRKQLAYVYEKSTFYRKKFDEAGVRVEDVRTVHDLHKLPFMTKEEIRKTQAEDGGCGAHLCAPVTSLVRVQGSSGTTGRPIYVALTARDADNWRELFARHAWCGGIRPGDSFINPANFTLFVGGLSESVSAEAMGFCVIPAPLATTGIEKLMQLVLDLKPTVLFATPSATNFLAEYVKSELKMEPRELGFKKGFMAGEPLTEEDRRRIEEEWGITARNFYGMSDVAADMASECGESEGMHFCGQGLIYAELVDPVSLEPLEMVDGREGEIVYTHLDREATPVVRYRSRDLVRVFTSPCPCGRNPFRFTVLGRTDDMLKVKGVNVFPSAVKEVISSFAPETTGEFRIVLRKPGPYVDTNLELKIEYGEGYPPDKTEDLAARLRQAIKDKLVFTPVVHMIPPGTLPRSEYKIEYFERAYEEGER